VNDLSDKGMMRSWKMNSSLTYWDDEAVCNSVCNSLGGSRDPGVLPVDVNKKDTLSLFIGDLCRKMDFKYVQEVGLSSFSCVLLHERKSELET
jgi:hypothetical protein